MADVTWRTWIGPYAWWTDPRTGAVCILVANLRHQGPWFCHEGAAGGLIPDRIATADDLRLFHASEHRGRMNGYGNLPCPLTCGGCPNQGCDRCPRVRRTPAGDVSVLDEKFQEGGK